tara:strand:+ start:223 stop:2178 length:1956 start_codon:yes stop_codon:yes gene_type:complete
MGEFEKILFKRKEAERAREYRIRKKQVGKNRDPIYLSKEAERTRRYRERNPYQLKTTNITVNGKKYVIPNNALKPDSAKGLIKFLDDLSKNPTTQNAVRLLKGKSKSIQDAIRNYGYYVRGDLQGSFAEGKGNVLGKFFKDLQTKIPKQSTNFLSQEDIVKKMRGANVGEYATPVAKDKITRRSFEKVIEINNEFKKNPKITLNKLTENIYGNKFLKANNSQKLRLATNVSDDVAKYLEALKEGSAQRKAPRGMGKEFNPPTGKKYDDIVKYITSQKDGFRFQDATLRNYKYNIRDSLLGFNPRYTRNLEMRVKNIKGVLDHAVGLSATHKVAPGYSGIYQDIESALNQTKGIKIDKPFTKVLRQVVKDKNFKGVDAYNKLAAEFQKTNKIDVPFIRKGGDPRKLVSAFSDLDVASQQNILKLAKGPKGFAIETKGSALVDDMLKVRKFAKSKGFTLNSFAGVIDLSQAGLKIPPSILKSMDNILTVGGKLARGAGKAALVIDPMFAAMDFSKATDQGVSGGQAATYTAGKFGQDLLNLPGLITGAGKYGIDYLQGDENRKFETPYELTFANDYLKDVVAATPEDLLEYRKANRDFDVNVRSGMTMVDDMEIPASRQEIDDAEKLFYEQRGVTVPKRKKDLNPTGIMSINT